MSFKQTLREFRWTLNMRCVGPIKWTLWEKGLWPTPSHFNPNPAKWLVTVKEDWDGKYHVSVIATPFWKRGSRYHRYSPLQFRQQAGLRWTPGIPSFGMVEGENCFVFSRTLGTSSLREVGDVVRHWVGELITPYSLIPSSPSFEVEVARDRS